MKKSTALGAVLCSAALAVGMAMPAFAANTAADATVNDPSGAFVAASSGSSASATTTVRMAGLDATQIVATVPVTITIAAPSTGGDIIAPSNDAYAITNNGANDIRVSAIKGTPIANVTLESGLPTSTTGNTGKAYLKVAGNMASAVDVQTTSPAATTFANADWTASGSTKMATDASLSNLIKLQLSGKAYPATGSSTFDTASTSAYVKIEYTITSLA